MKFTDLNLREQLQRAIKHEGYDEPTPIQAQAIPHALANKDIIGVAQTGTGKTAAFLLPLLERLAGKQAPTPKAPRALIVAPTRELALQLGKSIETYGKYTNTRYQAIYGGVSQKPQVAALQRGVDIVVATPGRLLDLINQKKLHLQEVEVLILDEADRMLDMGFIPDIKKIVQQTPNNRQTLLFSATMSKDVEKLTKEFQNNPVRVEVARQATAAEKVDQHLLYVDKHQKNDLLIHLLQEEGVGQVLVFTRTKHKANKVSKLLSKQGFRADAIHGNKSQNQRTKALNRFKNRNSRVLVATDVASRGIDVDDISHVINYELPNEAESYVHRIGRTGRAGSSGVAWSFCAADEKNFLKKIERTARTSIPEKSHRFHSEQAKSGKGNKRGHKRKHNKHKRNYHHKKRRNKK